MHKVQNQRVKKGTEGKVCPLHLTSWSLSTLPKAQIAINFFGKESNSKMHLLHIFCASCLYNVQIQKYKWGLSGFIPVSLLFLLISPSVHLDFIPCDYFVLSPKSLRLLFICDFAYALPPTWDALFPMFPHMMPPFFECSAISLTIPLNIFRLKPLWTSIGKG